MAAKLSTFVPAYVLPSWTTIFSATTNSFYGANKTALQTANSTAIQFTNFTANISTNIDSIDTTHIFSNNATNYISFITTNISTLKSAYNGSHSGTYCPTHSQAYSLSISYSDFAAYLYPQLFSIGTADEYSYRATHWQAFNSTILCSYFSTHETTTVASDKSTLQETLR